MFIHSSTNAPIEYVVFTGSLATPTQFTAVWWGIIYRHNHASGSRLSLSYVSTAQTTTNGLGSWLTDHATDMVKYEWWTQHYNLQCSSCDDTLHYFLLLIILIGNSSLSITEYSDCWTQYVLLLWLSICNYPGYDLIIVANFNPLARDHWIVNNVFYTLSLSPHCCRDMSLIVSRDWWVSMEKGSRWTTWLIPNYSVVYYNILDDEEMEWEQQNIVSPLSVMGQCLYYFARQGSASVQVSVVLYNETVLFSIATYKITILLSTKPESRWIQIVLVAIRTYLLDGILTSSTPPHGRIIRTLLLIEMWQRWRRQQLDLWGSRSNRSHPVHGDKLEEAPIQLQWPNTS